MHRASSTLRYQRIRQCTTADAGQQEVSAHSDFWADLLALNSANSFRKLLSMCGCPGSRLRPCSCTA